MHDKETKPIEATVHILNNEYCGKPLPGRGKCVMKWILMFSMYLRVAIVTLKDAAKLPDDDHYYRFFNFNRHFEKDTIPNFWHELSYYFINKEPVPIDIDNKKLKILLSPPPSPPPSAKRRRRSSKKHVTPLRRSARLANLQRSSRRSHSAKI